MTEKRFEAVVDGFVDHKTGRRLTQWFEISKILNDLEEENKQLKKDLKRCREWLNSDKYDYETTLAFIKSKGYSLKDVLEYKGDVE